MPVEITLPDGQRVRSDHLPAGVIADVAKRAETNWAHVVEGPHLGDGFAMLYLYEAACARAGQPFDAETMTAPEIAKTIEVVGDDRPDTYEGGMPVVDPPDPASPVEDSPETT